MELEPVPGRWRRAARVGFITALGAGATAAMQIANPLGLTLLFNFALPEAAFSIARGTAFVCFAAVFEALGLMLVGALIDSPVFEVTVFILLCLVTTYVIYAFPTLGRLWVWIQVPVATAFYLAIFVPQRMVWNEAQGFAGIAIAVGVLLLCNSVVRPESAALVLAESVAAALARLRQRLATLMEASLCGLSDTDEPPIASRLGYHLSLLAPFMASDRGVAQPAALLSGVTVAEAVRGQTNRLAVVVHASERRLPPAAADELRALGHAVGNRFDRYVRSLPGSRAASFGSAAGAAPETERVSEDDADLAGRIERLGMETPELAPITARLARICELLTIDRSELLPEESEKESEVEEPPEQRPAMARNFLFRFSTRHTLALTLAFLVGLWDNDPALHAAIWLLMLGGPPSHGATVRKFTMRAVGASGALALAAIGTAVIAPNFTSPMPYMLAIFAGTALMAYIGEGGGILSYLAIGGTAFVIGYGGPGPRSDVLGSIWSIWGISLGMIIRAGVSLLWRERPSRTLAEEFQPPLTAMLEIVGKSGAPDDDRRRGAAERAMVAAIATMLTVANDAMLGGGGAEIDGGQLVGALDTLRRLAFAIGNLVRFEPPTSTARAALTDAIRLRCESWLRSLRDQTDSDVVSLAPLRKMIVEAGIPELRLAAGEGDGAPEEIDGSHGAVAGHIIRLTRTLEHQLATVSRN